MSATTHTTTPKNETLNAAGKCLIEAAENVERADGPEARASQSLHRLAFTAALNYAIDGLSVGSKLDDVEEIFGEVINNVTMDEEKKGQDAAQALRQRGENLVAVA